MDDLNQLNFSKLSINSDDFKGSKFGRNQLKSEAVTDFFMKDFQGLPFASELEKKIFQSYETKNQSIYES